MRFLKTIFIIVFLNLLVIISVGFLLNLLGVTSFISAEGGLDLRALAIFSLVFGFSGSLISLLLSKQVAKWMMGVQIVTPASPGIAGWLASRTYEIARAAGLKSMPEVGIYDSPEVNAFATGPSENNALVAFSSGLLRSMNQEEIEGVIAHEISHIKNGDMVTMTVLQGVVNTFVIFLSRFVAFTIAARFDENKRWLITTVLTMVLEVVFMILASLVVFYFSRVREYAADRDAGKLVGANKMIAALERLKRVFEPKESATPVDCMKIAGGMSLVGLFSSHPPLEKRIEALKKTSRLS